MTNREIVVDISKEACAKYDVTHGEQINTVCSGKGTVVGIAPAGEAWPTLGNVIWCYFEQNGGDKVSFEHPRRLVKI